MALRFISAYHKGGGELELRPAAIAVHYLRRSFLVDLIGLLPLELWLTRCWPDAEDAHACFTRGRNPYVTFFSWQWLHLLRWSHHWAQCDWWRSITATQNDGPLQTIKYLFLVFMLGHLCCCTFYWASFHTDGDVLLPVCRYTDLQALPWVNVSAALRAHNALDRFNLLLTDTTAPGAALLQPTSAADADALAARGMWSLYIFWYYAAFAAMLGDPFGAKNDAARVLAVAILLVGALLFAVVFAEVLLCIQRFTASSATYAARMNAINETMNYKRLPPPFQRRVRQYYEYLWLVDGAAANDADKGHPMTWLSELPTALRVDINASRYDAVLRTCPLFDGTEHACLVMIAQQLGPALYMRGEVIVKEGLIGYSMYFIERGLVRVVLGYATADERTVGTLTAGEFFGERALTAEGGAERGSSVLSLTLLMLQKLTRAALEAVAAHFPELLACITQVANDRRRELGEELRLVSGIAAQSVLVGTCAHKMRARLGKRGARGAGGPGPPAAARVAPAAAGADASGTDAAGTDTSKLVTSLLCAPRRYDAPQAARGAAPGVRHVASERRLPAPLLTHMSSGVQGGGVSCAAAARPRRLVGRLGRGLTEEADRDTCGVVRPLWTPGAAPKQRARPLQATDAQAGSACPAEGARGINSINGGDAHTIGAMQATLAQLVSQQVELAQQMSEVHRKLDTLLKPPEEPPP